MPCSLSPGTESQSCPLEPVVHKSHSGESHPFWLMLWSKYECLLLVLCSSALQSSLLKINYDGKAWMMTTINVFLLSSLWQLPATLPIERWKLIPCPLNLGCTQKTFWDFQGLVMRRLATSTWSLVLLSLGFLHFKIQLPQCEKTHRESTSQCSGWQPCPRRQLEPPAPSRMSRQLSL